MEMPGSLDAFGTHAARQCKSKVCMLLAELGALAT
jgi:hypothetical protein